MTYSAEEPFLHEYNVFEDKEHVRQKAYDYAVALMFACLFPVMRYVLDRTLLETWGRRVLRLPAHPKKADDAPTNAQLETLEKFKESAYKCIVQIILTSLLAVVVSTNDWAWHTRLLWSECEKLPCQAPVSLGERLIYCVELGFYVQAIPMLFLWETKRKDRLENFAHHVATIALIAYSYFLNLTRVGIMVLVCHEANDIFLEAAKMGRYIEAQRLTDLALGTFVTTWFVTRVFAFPLVVIRSTLFEAMDVAQELELQIQPHHAILNGFLIFLYCLHIYWTYLILRIAFTRVKKGEVEDIRENKVPKSQAEAATEAKLPHEPSVGQLADKM